MSTPVTYPVSVEGIGDFVFRRRMIRDQIRIQAEASRITGGPTDDPDLKDISLALATLIVLTVEHPPKWTAEELDPLDKEISAQLWRVFGALRVAEDRFRGGA